MKRRIQTPNPRQIQHMCVERHGLLTNDMILNSLYILKP